MKYDDDETKSDKGDKGDKGDKSAKGGKGGKGVRARFYFVHLRLYLDHVDDGEQKIPVVRFENIRHIGRKNGGV